MEIRAGILTVSDSRSMGTRPDTAGPAVAELCRAEGWTVAREAVVADEQDVIESRLRSWSDEDALSVIFTTGGTGFARRDVTPEATLAVLDRQAPGFAELMRAESQKKTPLAAMSRAVAGIRAGTVIINLPGSERAARENFAAIAHLVPHAAQLLAGDTEH